MAPQAYAIMHLADVRSLAAARNRGTETETMADLLERITIDPAIAHGKPVVRGLRYPVEMLLELLSSGITTEEILSDYEDLERDDLLAVFAYAAQLARVKRMEPIKH